MSEIDRAVNFFINKGFTKQQAINYVHNPFYRMGDGDYVSIAHVIKYKSKDSEFVDLLCEKKISELKENK